MVTAIGTSLDIIRLKLHWHDKHNGRNRGETNGDGVPVADMARRCDAELYLLIPDAASRTSRFRLLHDAVSGS